MEIKCNECEREIETYVRGFEIWAKRCPCADERIEQKAIEQEQTATFNEGKDIGYKEGYDDGYREGYVAGKGQALGVVNKWRGDNNGKEEGD